LAVGFGAEEGFGLPAFALGVLGEGEQLLGQGGLGVALLGRLGQGRIGEFVFARLLDEFPGALQRRQVARDAVEHGGALVLGALLFCALDFFPLCPDGIDVFRVGVAEDVRVAADELVGDGAGGFLEVERLSLPGQLAVEDDLQQEVAAFLEHLVVVLRLDGVDEFVHLLDGVEADRLVILLAVPRAAARAAQATLRAAADVRPESTGLALETAPDVGPVADALPDEVAVRAEHHPHESPRSMTFPLVVLAALSMVGGLVQLPFSSTTKRLEHWLEPTLFHNEAHLSIGAGTLWILAVVAVLGGLVGIGVAVAAYAARRVDHRLFEQPVLANAWRLDRAVSRFMGGPGRAGFEAVARFDEVVVDGAVDGVATLVRKEAGLLRRFHNGLVRTYAVGIGVGAVGLVAWFLSRSSF